ncbi:MAG: type I restriction endonuclease subunit R, partial [Anaerolineae bacterium]|nr:type I restriction endonuclease subunit R [Anaerolineae bacterium]
MTTFTESVIEQAAIDWLKALGYEYALGPEIAPDGSRPERESYESGLLPGRVKGALARLNPGLPATILEEAYRQIANLNQPGLLRCNHAFHRMAIDGVAVEYRGSDGRVKSARVRVFDFDEPENNDWLAVNQFTVEAAYHNARVNRRADLVIFVNGLPLAVMELKNAAVESATMWDAFNQLQTYKEQIPALFTYNEALVISDGLNARIGSVTANKEWFLPWKTIEGEAVASPALTQLEVLLRGVFDKRRLLALVRFFIVFEHQRGAPAVKKMAGYHQFHAVNAAVAETVRAASKARAAHELRGQYMAGRDKKGKPGDRRIGVVWHTQGAGKSLTMIFYAGRLAVHPAMENPTIVVITDRIDL